MKVIKLNESISDKRFTETESKLRKLTNNFTKEGQFNIGEFSYNNPESIDPNIAEKVLAKYYQKSGIAGDSENPDVENYMYTYKPICENYKIYGDEETLRQLERDLQESVNYPNGKEVSNDDVNLDIALDYMFGEDRDPNNDNYI